MRCWLRLAENRIALAAMLSLLAGSAPGLTWGQATAVKPSEAKGAAAPTSANYEKTIRAFEEADKASPPPRGEILFIGASSVRLWKSLDTDFPGYKIINRGFGGSQLPDSVYYADRIVIPYKPRLIVLNAGGNDINAGKSPQDVFAAFRTFVEKVRAELPETRIAFLSLSPSPKRWEQAEKQRVANRLIKEYIAAGKNLDYIELWDQFLGADGIPRVDLFVEDQLHNNAAGYKIRAEVVRPHLQ